MKYAKQTEDGYILMTGINSFGEEITKEEYDTIMEVIQNRPEPREGYDFRLKEDLTWEEYELPVELTEEEA